MAFMSLLRPLPLRPALCRLATRPYSSSAAALHFHPASPFAPRESPTPVILLGGVCGPPAAWRWAGITQALTSSGFNVAELDLLRPRWRLCAAPLDDVIGGLRDALSSASFGAAPLVLAHGPVDTALAQKYLESWPLAGVVMLAPLAPGSSAVARWEAAAGGGAAAAAAAAEVSPLPLAACPQQLPPRASALAAALAATGAMRGKGGAAVAASVLLKLLADPVRLEPQPVPILMAAAQGGALCSEEELRAAGEAHEVQPVLLARGGGRPLAEGGGTEEGWAELRELVMGWVKRRF